MSLAKKIIIIFLIIVWVINKLSKTWLNNTQISLLGLGFSNHFMGLITFFHYSQTKENY
jgi:hypothetical protein